MRLIEVLEESAADGLLRKLNALDAIIRDPSASDGEKRNAAVLKAKLQDKLNNAEPPKILNIEERLLSVLQNQRYYCDVDSFGRISGVYWMKLIEFLNQEFSGLCKFIGKSPGRGDYSITTDFGNSTITISYNRSYHGIASHQAGLHFLGKMLFADVKPLIDRMYEMKLV